MSRTLGEAIIAILPDTSAFKRLLQAKIKEAMRGVSADVTVNPNTAKLDAALAASKAKVADLNQKMSALQLDANNKGLTAKVADAKAKVAGLNKETSSLKMDANAAALTAKISDMEAKSSHLRDQLATMKAGVDATAAFDKMVSLDAQVEVLKSNLEHLKIDAESDGLKAKLAADMAALEALKDDAGKIKLQADADKLNAMIVVEKAKIDDLTRKRDLNIKIKVDDAAAIAEMGLLRKLAGTIGIGGGGGGTGGGGKNGLGGLAGEVAQTALPGGGATTLPGIGGLAGIGVGILSTGFAGIIPEIVAATGALSAFGLLAAPTIKKVITGLTALTTASTTYGNASAALNAGIRSSPQNLAAYDKSLAGLSPQLAGAAELLTNQKVTWQNLTPAQRASEVALKNNAAAYKALLPAQKNALNALLQEGQAYNAMSPAQRAIATGVQGLEKEFNKLATAVAPLTLKVFNAGLKVANDLLPDLLPFAQAAGGALLKLLAGFDGFAKSAGFKAFLANMAKLAGPAILAIGEGLGKVVIAIGKLLIAMESPDALVILTGLFRVLAFAIDGIAIAFTVMTPVMVNAFRIFNDVFKLGVAAIIGIFKALGDFLTGNWGALWRALLGMVRSFGKDLEDAFLSVATLWDKLVPVKIRTEIANIFDGIRHDVAHIWDLIYSNSQRSVQDIHNGIVTAFDATRRDVSNVFDNTRHDIAVIWGDIYGATVGVVLRIGHDVEADLNNMRHAIANIFNGMRGDISNIWDNIGSFFAHWWGSTEKFFETAVSTVGHDLSTAWSSIENTVKSMWGSIGSFFASWWGSTRKFFDSTVSTVGHDLSTAWGSIENTVKSMWGSIGSFFAGWWGSTRRFFDSTVSTIGHDLSGAWNSIENVVKKVWGDIGGFFASWWGSTRKFFDNTVSTIGHDLLGAWNSIKNDVSKIWGEIGSFFAGWWGSTANFFENAAGKTIRNLLSAAWRNIGSDAKTLWNDIGGFMGAGINAGKQALANAINFVINNILNPLVSGYNTINDIWSGANVNPIKPVKFAAGGQVGKVVAGTTDTADDVLIRVSKNETILSADHSRALSPALAMLGVPGYSKGGIPRYQYGGDPGTPGSGDAPMRVRNLSSKQQGEIFSAMGVAGYAGGGSVVTGAEILSDAAKWQGHKYVWGGASNPQTGWDCSSFAGYILGHDFGFKLPGGVTWNPKVHGPTANMFTGEPGFGLVSHNTADIQAGDLLVEDTGGHVGFGVGPNRMFSAYDTASGTIYSNAANMTEIMRIGKGVKLGPGALPGGGPGGGGSLTAAQIAAFNKYMTLVNKDISLYSPAAIARAVELNPGALPKGVLTTKGLQQYNTAGGNSATLIKPAVQNLYNAAAAAAAAGPSGSGPAGVGGSAGEMANGKQIYNYLLTNLFGGHKIAAAGATASIWGECLTLDHLILTRRGWLKHDEVQPGDETIGYNPATGKSEWTRVTRVVHYADMPVITYGNQYWNATFTPNHGWLTRRVGREHYTDTSGIRRERMTFGTPAFKPWNEFDREDQAILAVPADTGGGLPITDEEAALLGWIAGDGGVSDGTNAARGLQVFVYQAKAENFAHIDNCLPAGQYTHAVRSRRDRPDHEWRLSAAYARDLLNRAGNPKTDAASMVLAMSSPQRTVWLDAMYRAEGTKRTGGRAYYQNPGSIADAIELAIYLEGRRPGVCENNRGELSITDSRPYIGGYKHRSFSEDAGTADVWCVTTELGSWTARNESGMFLTQNSTWNPFAQGTGGRGLIGWTPASTISNADFSGGMKTQLPAILRFVTSSGDSSTISEMFQASSVLQAANEWGKGVERFGINDVHSTGLALAKQIAGLKAGGKVGASFDSGGTLAPGGNYVWNGTGKPEPLVPAGGGAAQGSMSPAERAILTELRAIRHATQNAPVTFGRAINGAAGRGASRGYYGS